MLIMFFFMTHLMAQETVNGTVVDPDGVPLPGVNVVIKGTNSGTSTDFDGNFTIDVSSSDVLEFSFVGFKKIKMFKSEIVPHSIFQWRKKQVSLMR